MTDDFPMSSPRASRTRRLLVNATDLEKEFPLGLDGVRAYLGIPHGIGYTLTFNFFVFVSRFEYFLHA